MFQPRIIGALTAVGLLTQSPFLFLATGALLVWSALLPKLNPFEALYMALVARPRGLPRIDTAPPPRRFAQGMAATFMLGIALALLSAHATVAFILEALLVAALLALIFGRFCLGSYVYHVVTGRLAFANRTLPWRREAMSSLPDYVLHNREHWDKQAPGYVAGGERHWAAENPTWGIWSVPESEIRMIPDDISTRDVIELGCGTAYVSSWLARRGAKVVGIDNSEQQLETARRLQKQHGLEFPLIHGNAESVPYPDQSFDFAISEYGACLWADPKKWVAEAARLLRPGGRLHFLTNAFLLMLCAEEDETKPAPERLLRPAFGIYKMEWPGESGIEFHLSHADWVRLLRDSGFEIEDLIEIRPPEGASTRYGFVTLDWARKWPTEEVWKVKRK